MKRIALEISGEKLELQYPQAGDLLAQALEVLTTALAHEGYTVKSIVLDQVPYTWLTVEEHLSSPLTQWEHIQLELLATAQAVTQTAQTLLQWLAWLKIQLLKSEIQWDRKQWVQFLEDFHWVLEAVQSLQDLRSLSASHTEQLKKLFQVALKNFATVEEFFLAGKEQELALRDTWLENLKQWEWLVGLWIPRDIQSERDPQVTLV